MSNNQEQIKELKVNLSKWIYELSMCYSESVTPIGPENIKAMIELIVRIILANNMPLILEPYCIAVRKIACGKIDMYRFNVVNLMRVFTAECDRYNEELKSKRPERW